MEAMIVQGGAPEDAHLVQDAPMTGSGEAGAVPDAAPAQSTAQAHSASLEQASLSFEEIRHRLTRVVESMIDKDEDKIFSEPVSRELYPTYYDMIMTGMDLGTIKQRLNDNYYSNDCSMALKQVPSCPP